MVLVSLRRLPVNLPQLDMLRSENKHLAYPVQRCVCVCVCAFTFSKVLSMLTFQSKCTRSLTFEKFCQGCDLSVGGALGVCGVTLSLGSGEDVEQAEADVLGRAGTRKVRSRGHVPKSASCPDSPEKSGAKDPPASPDSPSVVEKCTLQARDSTRRLDATRRGGGGGGGSGAGGGKQLPLVRKTLSVTAEGSTICSLSRERVGSTGGVTMTTGTMDANGSGLTASVTAKSASPSHLSRKVYGNVKEGVKFQDLTPHAGAESSGVEGAGGRGAGGPVGRDHKDMMHRALNGNGALFRALSFGDARASGKGGNGVNSLPAWAGLGSTKKEVKNLHYKDNDRGDITQGGSSEHGDSGAKSHKTHDVVDSATPGLEETISFLLGRGGTSACGAMKIASVTVERTTSSDTTLAAARQTLDAARHMHEERRTASWRRQDAAAPRLTRARSEEQSTAARPLTANLEMMRKAEDMRRQGMLIQERRGDDVSGAPRQPGAPGRMSLDSSRLTRDAHAQLELIPLSHVPHDLLVTPLADNLEEGLKQRLQAQPNKGRLRLRTEPPPQHQQGQQQQQQQQGTCYGRGAGAQGAQLAALVPRPPASRDAGGRGGQESVQLLLHRVSKTRLPNTPSDTSQQRPHVKADSNEVLRIVCSQSSSCAHVDSHSGGGGAGAGVDAPRGRLCTSAHGALPYAVGGNVPGAAGLQLASKLRVLPNIALHVPGAVLQVANPSFRASLPR